MNVEVVLLQLWEVKLAKSCSAAKDKSVTTVEFLSTLNRHSRTVNVVRFSPDGEFDQLYYYVISSAANETGKLSIVSKIQMFAEFSRESH